jgi:hypothetical protein
LWQTENPRQKAKSPFTNSMPLRTTNLIEVDVIVHAAGRVCSWPSIMIGTHVENVDLPNSLIKNKVRKAPRSPATD